jgi:hypothetical protein
MFDKLATLVESIHEGSGLIAKFCDHAMAPLTACRRHPNQFKLLRRQATYCFYCLDLGGVCISGGAKDERLPIFSLSLHFL